MKLPFCALLTLLTTLLSAQNNCDTLTKVFTDKVTGHAYNININPVEVVNTGEGFKISISGNNDVIMVSFEVVGKTMCFDDSNNLQILFRDGSKMELTNATGFNCDGKLKALIMRAIPAHKRKLKTLQAKEIEMIRLTGVKGFIQQNFTKAQSNQLINTLNCITNNPI